MRSSNNPEWAGAVWISELDLSNLASTPSDPKLELAGGSDYHRTHFLIREGRALRGFVTAGIKEGRIWDGELWRAVDEFPVAVPEPEPPQPPISVVTCARSRGRLLRDTVDPALASDYPDLRIVIVDSAGPASGTRDLALRRPDPRVHYAHEPLVRNSHDHNRGLRATAHEYVAFVNDGVMVDCHWLTGIARGLARDPHTGLVCRLIPSGETHTRTQAWFDQRATWADARGPRVYSLSSPPPGLPLFPFQVGAYGTGANTALTRTAFESVGGFDVTLGGGQPTKGGEDIDLHLRMLATGYSISVKPSAITWRRHRSGLPAFKARARGYGAGMRA